MRSFKEAEEALATFDREHWKHPPGEKTAYHTSLHLAEAATRRIAELATNIREGQLPFGQFLLDMAGRFLEHSLRLVRACGRDIGEVLVGSDATTERIEEWIRSVSEEWRSGGVNPKLAHFGEVMGDISYLLRLCEQSDHDRAVDWSQALKVVPTFIGCAVSFGDACGPARDVAWLLERVFQPRLDELIQRFGYLEYKLDIAIRSARG